MDIENKENIKKYLIYYFNNLKIDFMLNQEEIVK